MKCVKSVIVYDSGVPGVNPSAQANAYRITRDLHGSAYAERVYPELAKIAGKMGV